MYIGGTNFGKIYLKAIRDTFLPIYGLWSGEGQRNSIFWCGVYPTEEGSSKYLACRWSPLPQFPPSLGHLIYMWRKQENPEEGA